MATGAWERREIRDRAQVGAFFGTLAGGTMLLCILLYGLGARWLGRNIGLGALLQLHGMYMVGYLAVGGLIGASWPLRHTGPGRWALWLLSATVLSVSLMSVRHGAPLHWPRQAWFQLAVMGPALAWVIGSGANPARRKD